MPLLVYRLNKLFAVIVVLSTKGLHGIDNLVLLDVDLVELLVSEADELYQDLLTVGLQKVMSFLGSTSSSEIS